MRNKPLVPDSDSETDHMMDGRGEKGIESERRRERARWGESMDGYAQGSSKGTQKGGECEPLIPLYYLVEHLSLLQMITCLAYPSASGLDTVSASGLIGHQARSHHDHPPPLLGEEGTRAES